ncbi:MAG: sulfite exporter TauE/SafE family protein [Acidimicrobiia bacterium]|nr:sulfite exporter TauE/SafE family protein [Acidimicrobiia bacterium]
MIIVIAIAGFLIGFSKAGVGGTLGPFVTVLVALTVPADDAIGLLLPMLIIADWVTMTAHWRQWVTPIVLRLLAAATVGIAFGSTLVGSIDEARLRNLIAIAMLLFVAYYLATKTRIAAQLALKHAWPAGLISGFVSALAHLGGPPIFAYLLTTDLKPRRFVATSAALFAIINLLKVPAYLLAGLFDGELISSVWYAWFAIPFGVVAGRSLVSRMDRVVFDRITTTLLVGGALVLLLT